MITTLIKLGRLVTTLGFLVVLLYIYAFLPEIIEIPAWTNMLSLPEVTKGKLFYFFLGIFIFISLITFFILRIGEGATHINPQFKWWIETWARTFSIILNIFLMASLVSVGINNRENDMAGPDYSWLVYFTAFLLVIWLIFLIIILIRNLFWIR